MQKQLLQMSLSLAFLLALAVPPCIAMQSDNPLSLLQQEVATAKRIALRQPGCKCNVGVHNELTCGNQYGGPGGKRQVFCPGCQAAVDAKAKVKRLEPILEKALIAAVAAQISNTGSQPSSTQAIMVNVRSSTVVQ